MPVAHVSDSSRCDEKRLRRIPADLRPPSTQLLGSWCWLIHLVCVTPVADYRKEKERLGDAKKASGEDEKNGQNTGNDKHKPSVGSKRHRKIGKAARRRIGWRKRRMNAAFSFNHRPSKMSSVWPEDPQLVGRPPVEHDPRFRDLL